MPDLALGWGRLHYRMDGPPDRAVLVLCNSLGADLSMWDALVPLLTGHLRVLRFDGRGQGSSDIPTDPYSMHELAGDVRGLLDALHLRTVAFCGQAFGSLVGLSLALDAPQRLHALILANSAARIGNAEFWDSRIAAVRSQGLEATADAITARWFSPGFSAAYPQVAAAARQMLLCGSVTGYVAGCAALRGADFSALLAAVDVPTLVIAGRHDPACPPEAGRRMAALIPNAQYRELDVGHLSPVENPREFAATLLGYFDGRRSAAS